MADVRVGVVGSSSSVVVLERAPVASVVVVVRVPDVGSVVLTVVVRTLGSVEVVVRRAGSRVVVTPVSGSVDVVGAVLTVVPSRRGIVVVARSVAPAASAPVVGSPYSGQPEGVVVGNVARVRADPGPAGRRPGRGRRLTVERPPGGRGRRQRRRHPVRGQLQRGLAGPGLAGPGLAGPGLAGPGSRGVRGRRTGRGAGAGRRSRGRRGPGLAALARRRQDLADDVGQRRGPVVVAVAAAVAGPTLVVVPTAVAVAGALGVAGAAAAAGRLVARRVGEEREVERRAGRVRRRGVDGRGGAGRSSGRGYRGTRRRGGAGQRHLEDARRELVEPGRRRDRQLGTRQGGHARRGRLGAQRTGARERDRDDGRSHVVGQGLGSARAGGGGGRVEGAGGVDVVGGTRLGGGGGRVARAAGQSRGIVARTGGGHGGAHTEQSRDQGDGEQPGDHDVPRGAERPRTAPRRRVPPSGRGGGHTTPLHIPTSRQRSPARPRRPRRSVRYAPPGRRSAVSWFSRESDGHDGDRGCSAGGARRRVPPDRDRPDPSAGSPPATVRASYRALAAAFGGVELCYAVKANPHPAVLALLVAEGASFDLAGVGELDACLLAGARPARMSWGNPVKKASDVRAARAAGVDRFTTDSPADVDLLAREAPGARVCVRLAVVRRGLGDALRRQVRGLRGRGGRAARPRRRRRSAGRGGRLPRRLAAARSARLGRRGRPRRPGRPRAAGPTRRPSSTSAAASRPATPTARSRRPPRAPTPCASPWPATLRTGHPASSPSPGARSSPTPGCCAARSSW